MYPYFIISNNTEIKRLTNRPGEVTILEQNIRIIDYFSTTEFVVLLLIINFIYCYCQLVFLKLLCLSFDSLKDL